MFACAGLCVLHGAARAQLIDQYLDPNVPGYATNPGVTVAGRTHPEYDAAGIRVGGFTLLPTLDESAGYDDNVTGTRDARGSALIESAARIEARDIMSDASIVGSLNVDNSEFPQQSQQSFTNWTASLGGSYDIGRDTITLAATHLNLNQTPRDLDAPDLDSPLGYRVNDVRLSYKLNREPLIIEPALDVSWYDFDNGSVHGVPYLQSYRDRVVYQPGITAGYEFATRRRIILIVRDANANYTKAPAGLPRQNFNDVSVLAGVSYDADGIVGIRVLGGYEARTFPAAIYKTIQAPIVEAGVTWTPSGLTTISGTAARYIEDSAAEATVGYTETAFKLSIDHELFRNIILNANAGIYLDDYSQGAGQQQFYTGGVGATWLLDRTFRLSADYTYSSRQSDGAASFESATPLNGVFGQSYSENVFRLHLRVAI